VDVIRGSITTSGEGAAGVLAQSGGLVTLSGTTITTSGDEGHGVIATSNTFTADKLGYAPSGVELTEVHIRTSGANSAGLGAFNGDSGIKMTGGSIVTSGAGGAGMYLGNGADVILDGVNVQTKGQTIRSYFGTHEDVTHLASSLEQTIEARDSVLETNNGVLMRIDRGTGGENGEVLLELRGNTRAVGNIENYRADGTLDTRDNARQYTKVVK